jgi:pSer/pThr/pTyr-binding forkhead associated (FHA) protein
MLQTRNRRPLSRTSLLPFPPPPSAAPRRQETYLILNPKDDKSERRVIMVPGPSASPVRVGRVVNPKTPAKFDNLLFDTKVLSRNHAEVFSDGQGRVFIRDLGSSNGTYINGFRLSADAVASEPFQLIVGQELVVTKRDGLIIGFGD